MKQRISIAVLVMSVLGCAHLQPSDASREPAFSSDSLAASAGEPTYETIRDLVVNKEVATIADLMKRLATVYPSYVSAFTLGYQSFSLHESSLENPRAIVFGNFANLILTFNGNEKQRSYSKLEVMSFYRERGYEFREISFLKEPNDETTPGLELSDVEFRSSTITISKANPRVCTQCHSEPARPIWQPYPFWPGMYGSYNDNLYRKFETGILKTARSFERGMNFTKSDEESEGFQRYLRNRTQNTRYSSLPEIPYVRRSDEGPLSANSALLSMFANQSAIQLRDRILAKPVSTEQLYGMTEALCRSISPNITPYLKSIDPNGHLVADELLKLQAADARVHDEDTARIYDYFGGRVKVTDPVPLADNSRRDDRDVFIRNVRSDRRASKGHAIFVVILKSIGIDVEGQTINLRREPVYKSGAGTFAGLAKLLTSELQLRPGYSTYKCF